MVYDIILILIVTGALGYTAWKDYKTEEISLISVSIILLAKAVLIILNSNAYPFLDAGLGLALGLLPFIIMAVSAKGGIGDAILMGALGFAIGSAAIVRVILLASFIYIIYGAFKTYQLMSSDRTLKEAVQKQYPYAPFVFIGWLIYLVFIIIQRR